MSRHYLLLVFAVTENTIRREYLELSEPDEPAEAALERWVQSHPDMIDRQRNREKTAARLRGEPLYVQLCHPSSWWQAQREAGTAPVTGKKVKRAR